MTPEQVEVQDWWCPSLLPVRGLLETHVLKDSLAKGKPYDVGTAENTLKKLASDGCDKEKQSAGQALIDFKEVRAGKSRTDDVSGE